MLGCATVNVGIQEDSSGQICIWIYSKLSGRERDLTCEFANRWSELDWQASQYNHSEIQIRGENKNMPELKVHHGPGPEKRNHLMEKKLSV